MNEPSNPNGLENFLDFHLGIDTTLGLLVQYPNKDTSLALDQVYRKGSIIGNAMSTSGTGRGNLEDFIGFISQTLNSNDFKGKKILEIGCGNGSLLNYLHAKGAEVIGIEPGIENIGHTDYPFLILNDYFPSKQIVDKYDIILSYGVLEHVENPEQCLLDHRAFLKDDGVIIFSVPNAEDYILSGDISIFVHEHWSYFDSIAIENLLKKCCLEKILLGHGFSKNTIFVGAKFCKTNKPTEFFNPKIERFTNLPLKLDYTQKKLHEWAESASCDFQNIGIYCPGRIINYTTALKNLQDKSKLRFFDDDKNFHEKYYPPYAIAIENFYDLKEKSIEQMLIASRSFGSLIKKKLLKENILSNCNIQLLSDLIAMETDSHENIID
ncbi:MAG: class I SAM-dependent methyltransferase [Oligoflexia bacterium]|nr:class I SAM-dependent methyltransferase [Oligoflexia bacterium]